MSEKIKSVPEMLRESAETYEQRNKLYGNSYKEHGKIMTALFPNGVTLESEDDHNRWGVFNMMVSKLKRYAEQMDKQGHDDSLLDLATYASMLRELDEEIRQRGAREYGQSEVTQSYASASDLLPRITLHKPKG